MTNEQIHALYQQTGSIRLTAKKAGIPIHKIRFIKEAMGWPTLKPRGRPMKETWRERAPGRSIYDAVESA